MSDINSGDFEPEETSGAQNHENLEDIESEENSEEVSVPSLEETDFSKEEQRLHLQALDLIGSVLDENYKGDPKKFFDENPELAAKANKSKKYKEQFRSLMDSEDSYQEVDEKPMTQPKAKSKSNIESEEDIIEKAALKVYNMNLNAERLRQSEEFAQKEGLNIDDLDTLHSSAKALFDANNGEISFSRCLRAAKLTLATEGKEPSVKIPSSSGSTKESQPKNDGYDGTVGQWVSV